MIPRRRDDTPPAPAGEQKQATTQGRRGSAALPGRAPARRPGPHDLRLINCSCATRPGLAVAGPESDRLIDGFQRDHGPDACGHELVHVPLSKMGRAQRA